MTDRLAEIKARLGINQNLSCIIDDDGEPQMADWYGLDVSWLVAEVERLRAELERAKLQPSISTWPDGRVE